MTKKLVKPALFAALGEGIYISLVALLMTGIQKFFGAKPDPAEASKRASSGH